MFICLFNQTARVLDVVMVGEDVLLSFRARLITH